MFKFSGFFWGKLQFTSNLTVPIDVRIICSTNKNLADLVKKGEFREDLFYRINVIELQIPPLRERILDLDELVEHFIHKYNKEYGLGIIGVEENVMEALKIYSWPGNIRELENVIKGACVLVGSGILKYNDFDILNKSHDKIVCDSSDIKYKYTLEELKEEVEKKYIINTLLKVNGNKTLAARLLGIDRTYLYTKLKKYNIET